MAEQRQRVLNDRYEIAGVLGQGGMAKVFKGTDRVLGRTVAVKVLAPQYADDEGFVARFRREAQAAAGLNHPNIVGVFDTGSQNGVHYIVMEYVEGRTLRDVIRADAPLLPERAIEITDAVARALAAAHESGLVHRDIKPGNIMLTRDGEVKVMDFGIARTTTGDTLTQTAAILGTALYLSPEQAQGQPVDARSDIYSLGCVFYEMLTAHAPFEGDSPVAIAYKHVRETPRLPSELNPDVPPELDAVVMKMLAKNPENRYQNAAELREDLERVRQGAPTLATPLLPGTATEAIGRPGEGTAVLTGPPEGPPERGRSIWPWVIGFLILLAIGALAFFLIRNLQAAPQVPVPTVIDLPERQAVTSLEQAGFQVDVQEEFNEQVERGIVFDQDPRAGDVVEEGSLVTITVSRGAQPVAVPAVEGLPQAEAEQAIREADLVPEVTTGFSDTVPVGSVISQDPPAEEEAEPGSTVTLVVSEGPEIVQVPDVICDPVPDAFAQISDAGLDPQHAGVREFSVECPAGTAARTDPPPGTEVQRGSPVTVVTSNGPEEQPSPGNGGPGEG